MNGIQVLIIDDEESEREAIKTIIEKNCPSVSAIFLGYDGESGLAVFRKEKPDVVFVDINMVGISGLETIQKMQEIASDSKFVVVSAYNLFAYAKEAIKLKVWDFLVKPVGPIEVIKIIDEIASEQKKQEHGRKYFEKLESISQIIEENFILSVSSINYSFDISGIKEYFDANLEYGQIIAIKAEKLFSDTIRSIKEQWAKNNVICLEYSSADLHTFALLTQYPLNERLIKEKWEELLKEVNCLAGIGYVYPLGDSLRDSFMQAIQAVDTSELSDKKIVFFKENISDNRQTINIKESANKISALILERKQKEAIVTLNLILDDIQRKYASQAFLPNSFRLLMYICDKIGFTDENIISSFMQRLSAAPNKIVQREITNQIVNSLITELNAGEGYKAEELPHIMKHIIEQEYMNDLTLEELSARLSYSSYYLSRIFSKYYEKSFIEFLTEYRIERAKDIIKKNSNLSVKEISNAVGFHSQAYFARVFRKYCGVSPTEFKI